VSLGGRKFWGFTAPMTPLSVAYDSLSGAVDIDIDSELHASISDGTIFSFMLDFLAVDALPDKRFSLLFCIKTVDDWVVGILARLDSPSLIMGRGMCVRWTWGGPCNSSWFGRRCCEEDS